MISNCSINEYGKISGGKPGDNNGKEWRVRSWYNSHWKMVLRYPDIKVAKKIAELMEDGANNNNIGYNQYRRTTMWKEVQKVGYQPKAIKTPCAADCSSSTATCIKCVGYLLGIDALKNVDANMRTGTMERELKKAGFIVLKERKYLTSDKYLLEGDILLRPYGHTATNLTRGSKAGTIPSSNERPTVKQFQLSAIADGFKFPKYGADGIWGSECESVARKAVVKKRLIYKYKNLTKLVQSFLGVEVDGKCGTQTAKAIKAYQKKEGLVVDGQCGLMTWKHILNV